MKKNTLFLFIMIIILTSLGCSSRKINITNEEQPLSDFIIGKWRSDRENSNIYGVYHEEFFIKFINKEKLLFCNKKPNDSFCDNFMYEEIGDGIYSVDNNRINDGEWIMTKEEDELKVCIWSESNCLLFSRDTSNFNFSLEVLGRMK